MSVSAFAPLNTLWLSCVNYCYFIIYACVSYFCGNIKQERSRDCSTDANRLHALRYLLIQLLLQVLLRPGEFSEAASELIICCKKAFSTSDLPESSGEDDVEVDDAPELMDVLVDTLLSLLPQSSAAMRSSIEQVMMKNVVLSYASIIIHQLDWITPLYYLSACPFFCILTLYWGNSINLHLELHGKTVNVMFV